MKPADDAPTRPGRPSTHGLRSAQRALKRLGNRPIDRRTTLGKALARWCEDVIEHLGGENLVSPQQRALVQVAARTKLLVDSVDAWLLKQPSLVNGRKRALLPVVVQRVQLADSLARHLDRLGLESLRDDDGEERRG